MPFWEYEYFSKFANEMIEEENKQQQEQADGEDYSMESMERRSNRMMKNAQSNFKIPSAPKIPSFSMPKI